MTLPEQAALNYAETLLNQYLLERSEDIKQPDRLDPHCTSLSSDYEAFLNGCGFMRTRAIEIYRNLCPCYKISRRFECANLLIAEQWSTNKCNMNCIYMKNFLEQL